MAWTTGTCTGHLELLDALKNFLTSNAGLVAAGQAWTCLDDLNEADPGYYQRALYLKGPGIAGGQDEVYIGLKTWFNEANDVYNLMLNGFTGHVSGLTFFNQPGSIPSGIGFTPTLTLSKTQLTYWFMANGRRVIIVCRVNGVYVAAYLGLFMPASRPDQYPYPLFIGGNSGVYNARYSVTGNTNTNFWWGKSKINPMDSNYVKETSAAVWSGTWRHIRNYSLSAGSQHANLTNMLMTGYIKYSSSYNYVTNFQLNVDGSRPLWPLQMVSGDMGILGDLDGIYAISGRGLNSEDILDVDGTSYLAVANGYETDFTQYAAIALA